LRQACIIITYPSPYYSYFLQRPGGVALTYPITTRRTTGRDSETILIANRWRNCRTIIRRCAEMGIRSVAILFRATARPACKRAMNPTTWAGAVAGYLNARSWSNLAVRPAADARTQATAFCPIMQSWRTSAPSADTLYRPSARVIRRMGGQAEARRSMIKAGVPVTPGTEGNLADCSKAPELTERVGYPIMLKGYIGGVGRGNSPCNTAPLS